MTEIGPLTESGAAVVPQRPTTEAELLEWLVRLAMDARADAQVRDGTVHRTFADAYRTALREAMREAAKAWALERAEACRMADERDHMQVMLIDELADAENELAHSDLTLAQTRAEVYAARDRIAQLEEALVSAENELRDLRYATSLNEATASLDAEREERQAEQQRHAVEMGEERDLSAVLARAYVRESQRLGRGGGA